MIRLRQAILTVFFSVLAGCATPQSGTRIDNIPMYGLPRIERPQQLIEADEKFVREASGGLGSSERASEVWWAQAEEYFAQGNMDYAMRRYNQSWLLNKKSFKPYWGFGRVLLEQNELETGIGYIEKAASMCEDKFQLPAVLTDLGSAYASKAYKSTSLERDEFFQKADGLFARALAIDPTYGNANKRWAMSLYRQQKYAEAWTKVALAKSSRDVQFPPAFLKNLAEKYPEPK